MNPIKKALDGVAAALNFLLPRQTGYVPPPPMEYVTRVGPRFDMDDPFVVGVFKDGLIRQGRSYSTDPDEIRTALATDRTGACLNDQLTIIVNTGVGYVLYRVTVCLKEKSP